MRKLFTAFIFLFGSLTFLAFANPNPVYAACSVSVTSGHKAGETFLVSLAAGLPNTAYSIFTTPTDCTPKAFTTNAAGAGATTTSCSKEGSFEITAIAAGDQCVATFTIAAADGANGGAPDTLPPPKNKIDLGFIELSTDPAVLAGQIIEIGIGAGILLTIILLIIGGYEVLTSAGNPDQLERAKGRITAAVSGLLFLLAAALILNIIGCRLIGISSNILCP